MVPRYAKLEFLSYIGSGDPLGWLYRCEQFFVNQRTEESDKVSLTAFYLIGEAQLWFYRFEQEDPGVSWETFKSFCNLLFGSPMSSNPLGKLVNLKQNGSVDEYQKQFQAFLARVMLVLVDQRVSLFMLVLSEDL